MEVDLGSVELVLVSRVEVCGVSELLTEAVVCPCVTVVIDFS